MFEEVPIESSLKGIADKIKELIQNEDWEGLGAYIADGINKGLQKIYNVINWDNVGHQVHYRVYHNFQQPGRSHQLGSDGADSWCRC